MTDSSDVGFREAMVQRREETKWMVPPLPLGNENEIHIYIRELSALGYEKMKWAYGLLSRGGVERRPLEPTLCEAVSCLKVRKLQGEELTEREARLAGKTAPTFAAPLQDSRVLETTQPVEDDWSFLRSKSTETPNLQIGDLAGTLQNGEGATTSSTEADTEEEMGGRESVSGDRGRFVTNLVADKEIRVAFVQKSWENHANSKQEAPGGEWLRKSFKINKLRKNRGLWSRPDPI